MNYCSRKLITYFFIVVLILVLFSLLYLQRDMVDLIVREEFERLVEDGTTHRNVLDENYSYQTMHQIVLMGKYGDSEVIITNLDGKILRHSEDIKVLDEKLEVVENLKNSIDQIVMDDWENSPYIASVHPFNVTQKTSGYLVMLRSTKSLQKMLQTMNQHFLISGMLIFLVLLVIYIWMLKSVGSGGDLGETDSISELEK